MNLHHYLKIVEATSRRFYDPTAVWLHGGPINLEGDTLKRYGKSHSDMGALFFCKDVPVGRWYTATYAGNKGMVWRVSLSAPVNTILDFTNAKHRNILQKNISQQEYQNMIDTLSTSGHLDWTLADEEMLEPLGFRGVVFQERPKGMITGLPTQQFQTLPEAVLSVGIFNATDVHMLGSITPEEIWQQMKNS